MTNFIKKYFSFDGRIAREEYISFVVKMILIAIPSIIYFVFKIIEYKTFNAFWDSLESKTGFYIIILHVPILIVLSIASLAVTIKRLHDIGLSGWVWMLGILVGESLCIALALIPGIKGPNKYGPDPLEKAEEPEIKQTSHPELVSGSHEVLGS